MLKQADIKAKSNSYWMRTINTYIWNGVNMNNGAKQAIKGLTTTKIANYFKTLLASGNHIEVVMTPAK